MTEAELIISCKKGDRAGQEQLFIRYSSRMMGICMRYTRNRDDARDLLHDGFIKIFNNIRNFKEESSLTTWMSRIFINTALSYLKSRHNKYSYLEISDELAEIEDAVEEVPDTLLQDLSSEEVLQMVQQLPDKYRLIINLYSIDGFTHKMIAEQLGISEGTSKSQLSRGRQLLLKTIRLKRNRNEKARK